MAIDTALRRASVQAYTFGLQHPIPDGAVGAADRAVAAWFYAGLTYQSEAPTHRSLNKSGGYMYTRRSSV